MLVAENLSKQFDSGGRPLTALRDVTFTIVAGAFVAVVGPSGSGKTTLLGLLAGLDTPSGGRVILDGADLNTLNEDARARLRGQKVGFMFQNFQLIPSLTALENVQVPLELSARTDGRGNHPPAKRAKEILARVGLADRGHHFPAQLSGGEQQRVALARAFANDPRILFADEPTGNLDGKTGAMIVDLIVSLNRESGTTVLLVTHEADIASRATRLIRLSDGAVVEDSDTSGRTTSAVT
jgi:putative ABC transport system ATP-binding protein